MTELPERDESIQDLEPQQPESQTVESEDADAVKGGRKAGQGQQDYMGIDRISPV